MCCALFLLSSALDVERSERVALKKLARPFQSVIHAKRCYRELKLLNHFQHDNVRGDIYIMVNIIKLCPGRVL